MARGKRKGDDVLTTYMHVARGSGRTHRSGYHPTNTSAGGFTLNLIRVTTLRSPLRDIENPPAFSFDRLFASASPFV